MDTGERRARRLQRDWAARTSRRVRRRDRLMVALIASLALEAVAAAGLILFGPGAPSAAPAPTPGIGALVTELGRLAGTGGSPDVCIRAGADAAAIAADARQPGRAPIGDVTDLLAGAADAQAASSDCLGGRDLEARPIAGRAIAELRAAVAASG